VVDFTYIDVRYMLSENLISKRRYKMITKNKSAFKYEVRQHFKDNSEIPLKSFNSVIDATQYAIDCRKFDPEGTLVVYDLSKDLMVEYF
jgi:hypothetical protein